MSSKNTVPEILLVSELFPPAIGGSAVLLHEIYRRLRGRSITVLTHPLPSASSASPSGGALVVQHLPIATPSWGLTDAAGAVHHMKVAGRIRAMAGRRRTVVHCGRALPEGIAAWMSHGLWGPRYICWSHGEDVSVGLTSRELSWVMTRVYRGSAAVIANSMSTRSFLLGLGLQSERVHVVYPGVDADRFHPGVNGQHVREFLVRGGDTLLLSVGRLQRRKGHDLVIDAMNALRDLLPGLRYVIVGEGEERGRLERMVSECRLADRVMFAGVVPDEDLPKYFAASDMFLLPNRCDNADIEGFGIVFLEAAASGKPAIAGNSGGAPEAVDHERTGLLVSGTDAQELARAIVRLVRNRHECLKFGRAGRARVLRSFTWDQAAARVSAIHSAVAAGN